jgi:hypothetical protein
MLRDSNQIASIRGALASRLCQPPRSNSWMPALETSSKQNTPGRNPAQAAEVVTLYTSPGPSERPGGPGSKLPSGGVNVRPTQPYSCTGGAQGSEQEHPGEYLRDYLATNEILKPGLGGRYHPASQTSECFHVIRHFRNYMTTSLVKQTLLFAFRGRRVMLKQKLYRLDHQDLQGF